MRTRIVNIICNFLSVAVFSLCFCFLFFISWFFPLLHVVSLRRHRWWCYWLRRSTCNPSPFHVAVNFCEQEFGSPSSSRAASHSVWCMRNEMTVVTRAPCDSNDHGNRHTIHSRKISLRFNSFYSDCEMILILSFVWFLLNRNKRNPIDDDYDGADDENWFMLFSMHIQN